MRVAPLLIMAVAACGPTEKRLEFPATPEQRTLATLAGHRCTSADFCQCRNLANPEDATEKAPPPAGTKRFEFRVSSSDGRAWVTIDGKDQLFKNVERIEDCFYLDLPVDEKAIGEHTVRMRAKSDNAGAGGVGAALKVFEYGQQTNAWYEIFQVTCGAPGACDKDSLVEWKERAEADRRSIWDPCSSTKVKGVAWETGRMPDALHPEELTISFSMKIYPHSPRFQPRDETCPVR
jgi:hypothetical protein